MKIFFQAVACGFLLTLASCTGNDKPDNPDAPSTPSVPSIGYSVVKAYPHDTANFTEGFEFYKGTLLESTGMQKQSKLVQTTKGSGTVVKDLRLGDQSFGEGLTVLHDTLYQLTYQEHTVFVYTLKDGFKKVKEFPLSGEGWGLTNDGRYLIASNGSSDLFYYEPSTFTLARTLSVKENNNLVSNINELEFVDGFIYANQWQVNTILKIDANTGNVVGKLDLTRLKEEANRDYANSEVLNGIAYDPETKSFHVTGKYWPKVYEIKLN